MFCTSWKIIQNCHSGGLRWSTVLLEIHKGVWFLCFPWRIGKWDRRSAGDEERACKCLVSSWSQIKWICQGAWFWSFSPFNLEAEMRKRKTTTTKKKQKAGARRVWRRSGEWESLGCWQDILTMGPQVELDGSNTWEGLAEGPRAGMRTLWTWSLYRWKDGRFRWRWDMGASHVQ